MADADYLSWFSAKIQHVQHQLETLVQQENAQRQAIKIRDKAQVDRNQAEQKYSTTRDGLSAAQTALDQIIAAIKVATDRHIDAAQQRNDRLMEMCIRDRSGAVQKHAATG